MGKKLQKLKHKSDDSVSSDDQLPGDRKVPVNSKVVKRIRRKLLNFNLIQHLQITINMYTSRE